MLLVIGYWRKALTSFMSNPLFSLFRHRPFLYLWLAQIITQIGSNMLVFVLALHIFSAAHSNTAVGLLFLAFGLPNFLFGPPAGVWVDKLGPKKALLISNCGRTLLLFLFFFGRGNLLLTYLLAFLFSSLLQLFLPAGGVLLPSLFSGNYLLSANSLFSFTFYLSLILGFSAAGPLLKIFGGGIYFVFALFFLLATYLVTFLPPHLGWWHRLKQWLDAWRPSLTWRRPERHLPWPALSRQKVFSFWDVRLLFREVLAGLIFIRQRPRVLHTFSFLIITQISLGIVVSLAPGFAVSHLHVDLEDSSLLMILPAASGMIFGALLLAHGFLSGARASLPFYGWLLVSFVLLIIYPLVRFLPRPGLTSFLLFLLGVGNSWVDVPSQTVLQEEADEAVRGRVYGILGSFVTAGATLPVLLTTALADVFGVGSVLLAVGLLGLGLGWLLERTFARPSKHLRFDI